MWGKSVWKENGQMLEYRSFKPPNTHINYSIKNLIIISTHKYFCATRNCSNIQADWSCTSLLETVAIDPIIATQTACSLLSNQIQLLAGFDIFLFTSFFRSKAKFVNNNNKTFLLPSKKVNFIKCQFLLSEYNKEHSLANLYLSFNVAVQVSYTLHSYFPIYWPELHHETVTAKCLIVRM